MKENREAYGQLAERAARLLAAVAGAISKNNHDQEKLKGMEGNVARLLLCVLALFVTARTSDAPEQDAPGDQVRC
jgi:hypothetical protein